MKNYILKSQNSIYYNIIFILIFLIYISYFFKSFNHILGDKWAYNNLFYNYSSGFIRRGLLGEIFLKFNNKFGIAPLSFFTVVFFPCYFLNIIFFYKLFYKYKNYKLLVTILALSPATILFYVYDLNVMMTQDVFINLAILSHAVFIINKKINAKSYKFFLIFFLFPLITINILNHENQLFFLPYHFLLTFYTCKQKKNNFSNVKILHYYIYFLLPFLLILNSSGTFEKLLIINETIKDFEAIIPNQFVGNLNLLIGGSIKWHFLYHDVNNFYRLLFCFLMSVFLFYVMFQNLINKKIIVSNNTILEKYVLLIMPSFIIFLLVLDHGRTLHMTTIHLLSFYLILNLNYYKLNEYYNSLKKNFFKKNFIYLFLFFYVFLWYLPQGGGYTGIGNFVSLFKSTLFHEISNLF